MFILNIRHGKHIKMPIWELKQIWKVKWRIPVWSPDGDMLHLLAEHLHLTDQHLSGQEKYLPHTSSIEKRWSWQKKKTEKMHMATYWVDFHVRQIKEETSNLRCWNKLILVIYKQYWIKDLNSLSLCKIVVVKFSVDVIINYANVASKEVKGATVSKDLWYKVSTTDD